MANRIYISSKTKKHPPPGSNQQKHLSEEENLIESLRTITIPEEIAVRSDDHHQNTIMEPRDSTTHILPQEFQRRNARIFPYHFKESNHQIQKATVTRLNLNELGIAAENVQKGIQNLRKDLIDLRKLHLNMRRSFTAETQKKLLEFRKKAAKVTEDTERQKVDADAVDCIEKNHPFRIERQSLAQDQKEYQGKMMTTETELKELEVHMELIRINVIDTKRIEFPSQLEEFREELKTIVQAITDVKNKFYKLKGSLKGIMDEELELIDKDENFLKKEPLKIDNLINRCKALSGTLETLLKLATVQKDVPVEKHGSKKSSRYV